MLFNGELALITGAGRGNGEAIAHGLARHGARVVVSDIDLDAAERVAESIRGAGGNADALALDVCDHEACRAASDAVQKLGRLTVLVNNAGVRPRHAFDSPERDAAWRQAMGVNLEGIRNLTLACLPALRANRGRVVNITSIAAHQASPGSIAYSTSKAAAQMLTKVLALELASMGVRVNAVAPGVIETEMTRQSREDPWRSERLMARIPMARYGQPDDLVGPVAFLASDLSAYVTGAVLAVDGGYLAV